MIAITPDPVAVQLGPISVPWYGLGYAAAIALGVWLTQREARWRGLDPRLVADGILFVVAVGLIGARLYHVIDQWAVYRDDPLRIILPPYSGLGLYGGVIGGIVALLVYTRRRGQPFLAWGDAAVPALLLGQAIARWGNFFNQELYGPPTDLPWGIAIECQYRVAAYPCSSFPAESTGFHPLFFYESAANLVGALVAIWLARRFAHRLREGDLVAFWFIWYGAVRTALEPLREGYNWTFFGVPVAILIGVAAIVGGILFLVLRHRRPGASAAEAAAARSTSKSAEGEPGEPDEPGEAPELAPSAPGSAPAGPAGDRPADAPT